MLRNFKELIELTEKRIDQFGNTQQPDFITLEEWKSSIINAIELTFNPNHRSINEIQSIQFVSLPGSSDTQNLSYLFGHIAVLQKLKAILFTIERWLPDEVQNPPAVNEPPIVFIAHGGKKSAKLLNKLEDFLNALGAIPVIIEKLPNIPTAPSILEKIKYYMKQCNSGIALITAEDKIEGKEEVRGRPNVDNEIGMLLKSENIEGKIILLKQNDATLPSNYKELVWVTFSKKSMDTAFTEIVKNLRGYGFFQ